MKNKTSKFERLMANLEKAMSDHNKAIQATQEIVANYTKLQEEKNIFMSTIATPHNIE
jgi:galactitol-specific phosphotransferase system IIB component